MSNSKFGYKFEIKDIFTIDAKLTYSNAMTRYHLVWGNSTSPYPYSESISEFYEIELINYFKPVDTFEILLGLYYL